VKFFATRRTAIALGVALGLPSLALGYFADDWILLHDLRAGGGTLGAGARLYQFARFWQAVPGEPTAWMPWFVSPHYRTDFLRPLSGALFSLDEKLFSGGPLAHVHSLLWWLLLLVIVAALFRRLLPAPAAGLALLIFAVDDAHWQPMAWLANRHALIATTLVLAGLLAHLRWRDDGWRPGSWLSLIGYAAGLGAGETALQALAYLYGLELVERRRGWMRRLTPATLLVLLYGALRQLAGAGIDGSGIYFDPMRHPLRFAAALPARLAILLGDQLGGLPSDLFFAVPAAEPWLIAVGAVVIAVVAWLLWRDPALRARGPVLGLCAGGLLSVIPGAAGLPGSRVLLCPSLGSAALIATLILSLSSLPLLRGWLVAVHLGLAPLLLLADQATAMQLAQRSLKSIAASDLDGDVVLVSTPDPFLGIYPIYIEGGQRTPRFRSYQILSLTPLDITLTRVGPDALRLETLGGRLFDSPIERLLAEAPPAVGAELTQGRLQVRVASPTALELRFSEPLEPLHFLVWRDGALRRLSLPAVGDRVTIPHEPGMMGF
jgi:hypothetical protein